MTASVVFFYLPSIWPLSLTNLPTLTPFSTSRRGRSAADRKMCLGPRRLEISPGTDTIWRLTGLS